MPTPGPAPTQPNTWPPEPPGNCLRQRWGFKRIQYGQTWRDWARNDPYGEQAAVVRPAYWRQTSKRTLHRVLIQPRPQLSFPHVQRECRHRNPSRDQLRQDLRAGIDRRTRRPNIIHQQEPQSRWRRIRQIERERSPNVALSRLSIEAHLRRRLPNASHERQAPCAKMSRQPFRQHLRLVVAARPHPPSMQWNRHNDVDRPKLGHHWRHPVRQVWPPAPFVSVLERLDRVRHPACIGVCRPRHRDTPIEIGAMSTDRLYRSPASIADSHIQPRQ